MADNDEVQANSEADNQREFAIQRIYLKDLSFEAPSTPDIFREQWEPDLKLDLHTEAKKLEENIYEVILRATVTVKSKDTHAFLVEVKQAGIFTVAQFPDDQQDAILGSVCPSIIFPYLRETVSDIVTRGSFPQLLLAPVNFDALYAEKLKQKQQ